MPVPLHRSIDKKGALALSFTAFLVPVIFVLFVEAFLLPSSVRSSHSANYEDMSSALHQITYNIPQPALAARAVPPKMGYMLGNPLLASRQEVDSPDEDPAVDGEEEDSTSSSRVRTTSRTTSRASPTRSTVEDDDEDEERISRRPRPTPSPAKEPESQSTPKKDPKVRRVNQCAWSRMIEGTNTTPLWLTLGLSAGAIAGILIAAFTAYQYGKASKGTGGAAGMGGGAPPPMY